MLFTQTGGFIGHFTFGYLADKLGRRPANTIYSVIMAFGLVMNTILWDVTVVQQYLIYLCMFLVGFGTGMLGGYSPLFSGLFPVKIRGIAMGTAFNPAKGVQFFTRLLLQRLPARKAPAAEYQLLQSLRFLQVSGYGLSLKPEARKLQC